MRRGHLIGGAFAAGLSCLVTGAFVSLTAHRPALAEQALQRTFFPPLPPVPYPPDAIALTDIERLGKKILFDTTLSRPEGYACAQCHAPEAGYTSGTESLVNLLSGPQPGIVPGRSGSRRPQSYAYATFAPVGPYFDNVFTGLWLGGTFWDGRTPDLSTQAHQPFINPMEMNNTPTNGIYPGTLGGFSTAVVRKVKDAPYAHLFERIWGRDVFDRYTNEELFTLIGQAIAAFESSGEINQFSSKYDATEFGVPPDDKYTLSPSEERGRRLFFGKATCSACHSSKNFPQIQSTTKGKDTFTLYLFVNTGVPKNRNNPIYQETDCKSNPHGCNPEGTDFVDYGLGANPNPRPNGDGERFYKKVPGDIPEFRGLFQAPTLRNVDKRPSPGFVKAYMHNGVFKSLKEVVHFYNKRNIWVAPSGRERSFPLESPPPSSSGYVRLFAPPEVFDEVVNGKGNPGAIGNLGLSESQEQDIVNFLGTLSDGFTRPKPVSR